MQNEMIYEARMDIRKILYRGIYKDTVFYVVSYGSHPCAYVRATVPKSFIDYIPCHGGITYHDKAFEQFDAKGKYIGWDYANSGDYNAMSPVLGGKQWTVSEIIEDAKEVIDFVLYAQNFDFDVRKFKYRIITLLYKNAVKRKISRIAALLNKGDISLTNRKKNMLTLSKKKMKSIKNRLQN